MIIKNPKRRKPHILAILLIIIPLIIVVAVAAVFFLGSNSQDTKEYKSVLEQEMSDITKQQIKELDALFEENKRLSQLESTTLADGINNSEEDSENTSTKNNFDKTEQEKAILKEKLMVSYEQVLSRQRDDALAQINSLVSQAVTDYNVLKASGNDTRVNISKLASEYLAKSNAMETQIDISFNAITQRMASQLASEGIDPGSIIEKYNAEYRSIKEANRKMLIDKVLAK